MLEIVELLDGPLGRDAEGIFADAAAAAREVLGRTTIADVDRARGGARPARRCTTSESPPMAERDLALESQMNRWGTALDRWDRGSDCSATAAHPASRIRRRTGVSEGVVCPGGRLGSSLVSVSTTVTVKLCAVEGCERRVRKRGWCGTHYQRWFRSGGPNTGDPLGSAPNARPWRGGACLVRGWAGLEDRGGHDPGARRARTSRTKTSSAVPLGFGERALLGAMRRSTTGRRRKVGLRLGSVLLSWSSRVSFPGEGSPCPIPAESPVVPRGVQRSWGCSPRSPVSLCSRPESRWPRPTQRPSRGSRLGP